MSDRLAKCPFCDSKNVSRSVGKKGDGTDWPYIECEDCGASAEPEIWNRRAANAKIRALRAALMVFAGPPETGEHETAVPNDSLVTIKCQLGDIRRAHRALECKP